MASTNGQPSSVQELREELRRVRLERQIHQERMASQLLESYRYRSDPTPWGTLVPTRAEVEPEDYALQSSAQDRQRGKPYAAFRTESELREIQWMARWLDDVNVFALAPLTAVTNKVIRDGFRYRAVARLGREVSEADLQRVQDEIDRFGEAVYWNEWERELFRRSRRDGEAFLRWFPGPVLRVRTVEPEQVIQPAGVIEGTEWSFGVHCDPQDEHTVRGYHVSYDGNPAAGEEVDAGELLHLKCNVDRLVRRGLSDYFAIQMIAEDLRKQVRNMARGAGLLAAIAWIEQFESASKAQVEAFADEVSELKTTNPQTGRLERHERLEPGTVIRTGKGKTYLPPPLASANTPQLVEIARMGRMAVCTRWNAHESILGDASNGSYASLAVAESPFVTMAEVEQGWYSRRFLRVIWAALWNAVGTGRLPRELLALVDIHVEPPTVVVRDRLQQTQINEILQRAGLLSPQTWAQIEDLDFDQEQQEIARAKAAGWQPAAEPVPVPTAGGVAGLGGMLGEQRTGARLDWLRQQYGGAIAERLRRAAAELIESGGPGP